MCWEHDRAATTWARVDVQYLLNGNLPIDCAEIQSVANWRLHGKNKGGKREGGEEGKKEGKELISISNIFCLENSITVDGFLSNHPWRKLPNHRTSFYKQIRSAKCGWSDLESVGGKLVDQNRQRGLNLGKIIQEIYVVAEMVITWKGARKCWIRGIIM